MNEQARRVILQLENKRSKLLISGIEQFRVTMNSGVAIRVDG